ncbi:hypothetical protein EDC04DRAFT_2232626 [Pisolithus marmoratus]|nr:hypothetical protein EDC04DRAFT_2232626 [Pisolithus marmoratus]
MSSVTDSEATINAFVNTIHPSFDYILATTASTACVFTLFAVLCALSTKESRCRLAFRLNALAICLVLMTSILTGLTNGKAIVDPFNPVSTSVYLASIVFTIFPPLLYDSMLLIRLFALYPLFNTPLATLLRISAFPFCVKCARVVVLTLFLSDFVRTATTEGLTLAATSTWFHNPYLISEWAMQIADNAYSVSFFLYRLHGCTKLIRSARGIAERVRQIFYISVANFVFPLIFNIILIISIMTDRSQTNGALLMLINNYVTILGVQCATLWFSGSREWVRTRNEPFPDHAVFNSPDSYFGRDHVAGWESESPIVFAAGDGSAIPGVLDTETGPEQATIPEKENKYSTLV